MSRRTGLIALFTADVLSVLGDRVSMVAIPWLVLTTTGSPAKMGLVAGAEMLPYVVSGVLAAPLADRFGLRRTSIVTDLGSAVAMAVIVLSPGSSFIGLCLLVAVAGALRGLGDRVKHVMLKPMADAAGVKMIRVTSSYEGFTRTATLIGAPLGGLLISWIGPNKAITVDAISFLVCAALIGSLVRLPPAASGEPVPEREPYFRALRGGFAYIRKDQLLLGMIVMIFFLNVFNQASTAVFVPLWVEQVLKSPAALGLLFGGFAAGALLGNVIFTVLGPRLPQYGSFVIGAAVGGAPRLFTLGLSHHLWLVVTVSFCCGVANAAVNPVMGVTLYERVPAALQTRVFGVTGAIAFIGIPIGGVLAGWGVAVVGLRPAVVASGVILLLVTLVPVYRLWRRPVELAHYKAPTPEEAA
ncbi:putative MFS family arabinose efflux permease [Kribbella voronezhensis]|uniref:Putative MFS family arabinose efflux permease n=1 Tax=Kribbella voronezhensis TaxID=2512212 RepID=A0A4R7TFI4_9ACTN|nr:MFS transporter [Kribbella voronezhensis]TDU90955.1 putative MFS family arabinose efflux permease [Kribbella voronezhensis]